MELMNQFDNLGLLPIITKCLKEFKFETPSEIQALSIPSCLQGHDVIAQAQAGTGKTLCFLTTILQMAISRVHTQEYEKQLKITAQNDPNIIQSVQTISPFCLVIVPTRELALQIVDLITRFTQRIVEIYLPDSSLPAEYRKLFLELLQEVLQPKLFIGGLPIQQDRDILKLRRCSIAIGTLGRVMQLIQEGLLSLHNAKLVVLDEADKLFENKSFQTSFKKIIQSIIGRNNENKKPQILTFSATYPKQQFDLITSLMENPLHISTVSEANGLSNLDQYYLLIKDTQYQTKVEQIVLTLKKLEFKQAVVFYNDKNRGENLFNDLRAEGFKPIFIHGDQSQSDRIKVMHQMRRNKVNLIISTDLLSRGIDVDTLDVVIHFDQPSTQETYFHRIGRTGRFGTYGISLMFITEITKTFDWLQQWNGETELCNSKFRDKHEAPQKEKVYFAQFLNGVSNWRDRGYKFYDESKFKYKEDEADEVIVIDKNKHQQQNKANLKQSKEVIFERKKIDKAQSKLDQVVHNQTHPIGSFHRHNGEEILGCSQCKEMAIRIQQTLGYEFKILQHFNV